MAKYLVEADKFLDNCELGRGWSECEAYCTPDAEFKCAVLPQKTIHEWVDWIKGLKETVAPDVHYKVISKTWNDTEVTFVNIYYGTHSLNGGPVPVADTPKKMGCPYSYTLYFNNEGKIYKMYKVFDIYSAFNKENGWAWPLTGAANYDNY